MSRNFHSYFPVPARDRAWGLYATACGVNRTPPHAVYPSGGHPESRLFSWEQGRTLADYQLLYLSAGRGLFESAPGLKRRLGAGTLFLLFPGVWHRYRPAVETGWTESWIEVNGTYFDQLRAAGLLDARHPVHAVKAVGEVEALWAEALRLARGKPPGFPVRLGLCAAQILALVLRHGNPLRPQSAATFSTRASGIVSKAQALLEGEWEKGGPEVSPESVARKMGVSYSYFRREFKRQTGFSPKQYRMEIRHRRARNLLQNTALAVKEIAGQLGYSSPYHFTLDFRARAGMPPTRWRRAGQGGSPAL
ncbi:transcriptional regulator, AraC family [Verrucomicrobium sp. GAS474]|uniref:helix-turn-helix transcriptional regulator n=1 Tax=Verrucomicrobium sp. GAS474 TaxID=1882831 RepID=UPI00087C10BC|nr:AraC family transcriptional regulator [Verrucomicrobium sp. GAS474]SDT88370.1 transcriptional regulator, AraC family [Verrucomicrobium sp. GAS474]